MVRERLELVLNDILDLQEQQPNHDNAYVGSDKNERATVFILEQ